MNSLRLLPLPLFIPLFIFLFCYMIYNAIKRRNIDRRGLIVLYVTVSIIAPLVIIVRILEYLNKDIGIFLLLIFSMLGILFIEIFYMGITHKGDAHSKKLILISFGLILFSALLVIIILLL